MKKKQLVLNKETVRNLQNGVMGVAVGGATVGCGGSLSCGHPCSCDASGCTSCLV